MHTLSALLVAAVAACAIARPPGPTPPPASQIGPQRAPAPPPLARSYKGAYFVPKFLQPHFIGYEESPRVPPPMRDNDWLNKEIDRIIEMEEDEELINPEEMDLTRMITQDLYLQGMLESPMSLQQPIYAHESIKTNYEDLTPVSDEGNRGLALRSHHQQDTKRNPSEHEIKESSKKYGKKFALTPSDKEFYEPDPQPENRFKSGDVGHQEGGGPVHTAVVIDPPRQTRQNPNLSKQKHLLEPDIGKLKTGLANKDYRLPVSLLPTNLRWLKVKQPTENVDDEESLHEDGESSKHLLESAADPADSIYGVAFIAAVGAALTMAIFGFAFGWYTLSKKAKAAADVDYPAYGVTGPTMDTSGDRKLAHSAHMYHYQHQKQQIIAMERNGLEQRAGSISDPESEEENEEGDYTVYECPGFATTGDMEVKNPLFSEDPTPATPGTCEMVKPQPKE